MLVQGQAHVVFALCYPRLFTEKTVAVYESLFSVASLQTARDSSTWSTHSALPKQAARRARRPRGSVIPFPESAPMNGFAGGVSFFFVVHE